MVDIAVLSLPYLVKPNKRLKRRTYMSNPFDSNPFSGEPSKDTGASDAARLLGAARNLEGQARVAKRNKNWEYLCQIKAAAVKLLQLLWEVTKKAAVLAVFNFAAELLTRLLSSVTESLTKHKATVITQSMPNQQQNYGDPFSRHYANASW